MALCALEIWTSIIFNKNLMAPKITIIITSNLQMGEYGMQAGIKIKRYVLYYTIKYIL